MPDGPIDCAPPTLPLWRPPDTAHDSTAHHRTPPLAHALLDAPESTGPTPTPPPDRFLEPTSLTDKPAFRHSGWAPLRARVANALERLRVSPRRISRFNHCGENYWILRHHGDPARFRLCAETCRDRFCVPCGQARAALIQSNLLPHLADRTVRFITLTIRSNELPLVTQLDALYAGYRALRRSQLWRAKVDAACAFTETTYNAGTHRWHPHLHVLTLGRYIPVLLLSKAWALATNGSTIVHVQFCKSTQAAASYVTKYVTKPLHPSCTHDPNVLIELIHALKDRKLLLCTGQARRWRLLTKPDAHNWQIYASLDELRYLVTIEDPLAALVLSALRHGDPATSEFTLALDDLTPFTDLPP